jgi:2-polyprenyl-3-methyl-5-hydroxy-6-metoxy-1,4-benzoquinol methylase
MEQMVVETYEQQPEFYNPRQYRLRHEERLLSELTSIASECSLLDAFCGQGREAELFAKNGYDVTAIDRVPWMIEKAEQYARDAGFTARFVTADFNNFETTTPYSVVYTSLWMYSTVQRREQRVAFLNRCRALCESDGLIVISYIRATGKGQLAACLRFLVARVVAFVFRGNRQSEFGERIYMRLFWHHLSETTVLAEVRRAGLHTEKVIPGRDAEPTFLVLRADCREVAG